MLALTTITDVRKRNVVLLINDPRGWGVLIPKETTTYITSTNKVTSRFCKYLQNLLVTLFVLVMYVVVSFGMRTPQPLGSLINNTTFLFLTSVIVVSASIASASQRLRVFTLRYELDKSK